MRHFRLQAEAQTNPLGAGGKDASAAGDPPADSLTGKAIRKNNTLDVHVLSRFPGRRPL